MTLLGGNGVLGVASCGEIRLLPSQSGDVPGEEGRRWEDGGYWDSSGQFDGRVDDRYEEREQDRGVLVEESVCSVDGAVFAWQCCGSRPAV